MAHDPNRISSSPQGRPDRFKLDQRRWPVRPGRCCTAVNCNRICNPCALSALGSSAARTGSGTRRSLMRQPAGPSRGRLAPMPDVDRTADIKVTAAQGIVTAEMPLAGTASEQWLQLFRQLASKRFHGKCAKRGRRRAGGPHLGHRRADCRPFGPRCGVDAGYGKCPDQRGQWYGAAGSVRRRSNRSCYPRLVGA